MFGIPILFIVFNRPDVTKRVFHEIKKAKPRKLFVAADGPRKGVDRDHEQCRRVKSIFNQVDWDCDLHTLFRNRNFGCKRAVSNAIDWFFDHVEAGIILEDDCLPEPTFFRFCAELLSHFESDDNIMMITGGNFQMGRNRTQYSYYFSHYTHVWGWASWANRWRSYDVDMQQWAKLDQIEFLKEHASDKKEMRYWLTIFEKVFNGDIDTWDYQLLFANWLNNRLSIIPNNNLISNIGFNGSATHTKRSNPFANMPVSPMDIPLRHPDIVRRHLDADRYTSRMQYRYSFPKKLIHAVRALLQRSTQ